MRFSGTRASLALLGLLASVGVDGALRAGDAGRQSGARGVRELTFSSASYTDAALADEVKHLPGLEGKNITFRQFAGYLPISDAKKIFYWYVESQSSPDTDPLVFWTNGGPGCSGLIGFLTEHGPFRAGKKGQSLSINNYAWNRQANMLYVEQPVGVGFSTSEDGKLALNDSAVANDNYLVLQTFMDRFPHLRTRDLHVAGESYGGHYVPQLAQLLVRKNAEGGPKLNIKGMMVGNPLTDPVENVVGTFTTFWQKGLLPDSLYQPWLAKCAQPNATFETFRIWYCDQLQSAMFNAVGDKDPYGLSYPRCRQQDRRRFEASTMPLASVSRGAYDWATATRFTTTPAPKNSAVNNSAFEPCRDSFMTDYLNRDDVKAAIHANPNITWGECSDMIGTAYSHPDRQAYVQTIYDDFLQNNPDIRMLIFSGDDDSVCSTAGTKLWLSRMGWPTTSEAKTWSVAGGEKDKPAGTIQRYGQNFAFVVVAGAGHEVPSYKPEASLALFNSYLNDRLKDGEMAVTGL